MIFIEIPIHPDPKYFLQDLSLRSNVRFSLETRLDDPRISRPFYGGGGDLNNFEIFPQARRGNPLTCKTTLPLGLPRRLLLPRQRSDFFPASCPPTLQQTTPLVHLPILLGRRNAIDRTTNAACTLSPWKTCVHVCTTLVKTMCSSADNFFGTIVSIAIAFNYRSCV